MSENKVSATEVIRKLAVKQKELGEQVGNLSDRVTLDHSELDEAKQNITLLAEQVQTVSTVLFTMLSMHRDQIRGLVKNEDETVAAEANSHLSLVLEGQRLLLPDYYEALYGVSATTGEVLPGRTVGVADPDNPLLSGSAAE